MRKVFNNDVLNERQRKSLLGIFIESKRTTQDMLFHLVGY